MAIRGYVGNEGLVEISIDDAVRNVKRAVYSQNIEKVCQGLYDYLWLKGVTETPLSFKEACKLMNYKHVYKAKQRFVNKININRIIEKFHRLKAANPDWKYSLDMEDND